MRILIDANNEKMAIEVNAVILDQAGDLIAYPSNPCFPCLKIHGVANPRNELKNIYVYGLGTLSASCHIAEFLPAENAITEESVREREIDLDELEQEQDHGFSY